MDHFRIDDVDKFDKMFALIDADKPVEVYKNLHKDCRLILLNNHRILRVIFRRARILERHQLLSTQAVKYFDLV